MSGSDKCYDKDQYGITSSRENRVEVRSYVGLSLKDLQLTSKW